MKLGRVIGTVVATVKVDGLQGIKLLVVRPLTAKLEPKATPSSPRTARRRRPRAAS